jgi:CheY-like chemotaxis protein
MRFVGIPAYYYPTTTVFVDDSTDFLINFSLQLQDKLALKLFNLPQQALAFIATANSEQNWAQNNFVLAQESTGNPMTNYTVNFDVSTLQKAINNGQRFAQVSVAVVDYDMPGMTGIEFCRKLAEQPIKKILLTGKGDEKLAVEAFNEGIIDHFIQKSNRDVVKLVDQNVLKLQYHYFEQVTSNMRAILTKESAPVICDPVFKEFFAKIRAENKIVEYYLVELPGSFLLLDAEGKASLLVVKCYEDLSIYYEFAHDNGAPTAMLDEVRSGNKIPFVWDADDYFRVHTADAWHQQLFPAEELEGKQIYYYSLIKNPPKMPDWVRYVVSYNHYLEKQEALREI